jgi:hypothetical protein
VTGGFVERRRTPRVALRDRQELRLGRRIRVRVIDISAAGALVAVDERLPVGSAGRFQLLLDGHQFEAQVQVKREQAARPGEGYLIGLGITPTEARYQDVLDQFLARAGK